MKKILMILIYAAIAFSLKAQSAETKRKTLCEPSFFSLQATDTMRIKATDMVCAAIVWVPNSATDSIGIKGRIKTIDGITSGTIKLGPGESFPLGYKEEMKIDSVMITGKCYIVTLPTKN